MSIEALLQTYGAHYFFWVVLGCAVLENDLTFIMAGIFAASIHQHLGLEEAVLGGMLGALCHDSFWFWLGRNRSAWLKETKAWKRLGPQIVAWGERFGPTQLFLARFLPGTRNVSLIFWGVQRLRWPKFLALEAAGLLIWGTLLVSLGFWFSKQAQALLGKVKQHHLGRWLLLALLLSAAIYYGVRAYTRYRIHRYGQVPEDVRAD